MAVTMTDMHVKNLIEFAFRMLRANPDKALKEIFGDAMLDPHAAIYGQRLVDQVQNWFMKTKIPVVLGFDVVETELPCVTVHLQATQASERFIGDTDNSSSSHLDVQEREVVVPAFQPANAIWNADRTTLQLILPADMPFEQTQVFLPGLKIRDAKNREYDLTADIDGNLFIIEALAPLQEIELSKLELVSPVICAGYKRGAMVFDEVVSVVVHGHANRNEGLWLFYIVMYSLLKYRPVLEATYGLGLSVPSASDFSKDDQFGGENVWRRYITMTSKSVWSWEAARQQDIIGMITSVHSGSTNPSNSTVDTTGK